LLHIGDHLNKQTVFELKKKELLKDSIELKDKELQIECDLGKIKDEPGRFE
jgi:hypothetical protein